MNRNKTTRIITRCVIAIGIALTLLIGGGAPAEHGGIIIWNTTAQILP
jgi:hypothetical protein